MEFDLEKLVSKEEHLFSTCTQKVKYRKPRYETLEKDQRFWLKREERTLAFREEEWGEISRCLAPVFIALVEGTVKTLGLINWTGLRQLFQLNSPV